MTTRKTPIACLACVCALTQGCAYFNPLVDSVGTTVDTNVSGKNLPALKKALEEVSVRIADVEKKRGETLGMGRWLDFATFGLGVAAAGAALGASHVNTVRNATFGAGVTYASSSLFAPRDIVMVYHSGMAGLSCVANKGTSLLTTVIGANARLRTPEADPMSLVRLCDPKKFQGKVDAAIDAKYRVQQIVAYAESQDATQAIRVREAANNVIKEINTQVLARSNSPDAMVAAAKALNPHPAGAAIQRAAPQEGSKLQTGVSDECGAEVEKSIVELANSYMGMESALSAAANAMAGLDTACTVSVEPTATLALSQDKVTISKDVTFNVVVTGGRLPYSLTPIGTPSGDISVQLVPPRTIVVAGKSTLKAGAFTFLVSDNSVISTPVTLTITGLAPAAP